MQEVFGPAVEAEALFIGTVLHSLDHHQLEFVGPLWFWAEDDHLKEQNKGIKDGVKLDGEAKFQKAIGHSMKVYGKGKTWEYKRFQRGPVRPSVNP